ncbi:MAG: ATP-dependent DNA helicase [Candidatus Saccharibacteria bacterium]
MGSYKQALDGLNEAQRLAVTATDGPVLVIAGPGTGKTQLLATRIAHILTTTDTLPQNILCLTFTDSAAQNMRERLVSMIGQAAYNITISTYHAFGSDLIRRFPDHFTEMGELEPIDDLGIDTLFRDIVGNLPYGNPLKFADNYLNDVKSFVSDAKRALLTPADLKHIAEQNLAFIAHAQPVVHEQLEGLVRINQKTLGLFENLEHALAPLSSAMPQHQVAPLPSMLLTELREAIANAQESGKTMALTKWKNAWLAKDNDGAFIIDGQKTNEKLIAASEVYAQYIASLAQQNLFDYDDMILRAVHGLETNDDLRFTLQEQYQYILLDEFQDTNGAQLRLVELLTDNPVWEGRPNVLAVGDDDQAIYAFQGADYSHMLQFQRMYRNVLLVPLTQNYRSHADVLHVARGIAEQIEERLHHHFPQIEKTLVSANSKLPKQARIERREAKSDVGQFAWTAAKIRELMDNGVPADEIAILAPQHKYLEPLVPYLQELAIPVRYEKRENVLDDAAINQLLRMGELCLALQAGTFEKANALWAEVLSFGFWDLPTSLIWKLSWQASDDDQNWMETLLEHDELKPIALFFMRLSQLCTTETLETMFDYLIGVTPLDLHEPDHASYASPFYTHYFAQAAGPAVTRNSAELSIDNVGSFWDLLTNLTVLRARLREYKKGEPEPLKIQDFMTFVEAHRAANLKILNTSPYQDADKAVQLMTAFKAKGMEFGTVFVLAVNDEAWGAKTRSQGSRLSLPPNMQFMRYAGATNDERLRLFYVAVTRAKTQLFLLNYTGNFAGKAMSRLRYLDETSENGAVQSPLLPENGQVVLPAESESQVADTKQLTTYWQQRHAHALTGDDVKALLRSRLDQFQLSPTHVTAFIDLEHAGPAYFFMNTILRFPKAPMANGQFGNAMHETLEWIHIQNKLKGSVPNRVTIMAIFERRLAAKRLSTQETAQMLERGTIALDAYLAQRLHTIAAHNEAEYNFRREGVFVGKAHLSGKIDKLIIDRAAKTIIIVDYKTGKSYRKWDHDTKLHKYKQQLYLYRALIEGSRAFSGYQVIDAYLEFIEPDEQGTINELHITFDELEYAAIRQLAEVVWRRIQAIDIPDVSGYTPDIKGIEQFESFLLTSTETEV